MLAREPVRGRAVVAFGNSAVLRGQREGVVGAQALQIFPKAPLAFWKAVDAQTQFTTEPTAW